MIKQSITNEKDTLKLRNKMFLELPVQQWKKEIPWKDVKEKKPVQKSVKLMKWIHLNWRINLNI